MLLSKAKLFAPVCGTRCFSIDNVTNEESKKRYRMILLGASGFVGSAVGRMAHSRGWDILAASRRGCPNVDEDWTAAATWVSIDVNLRSDLSQFLQDFTDDRTQVVINCVGELSLNHKLARQQNSASTITLANETYEKRLPYLKHIVYISAAEIFPMNYFLHGYYYGKHQSEKALKEYVSNSEITTYTVLKPGFIYGNRFTTSGITIPLGLMGYPLEIFTSFVTKVIPEKFFFHSIPVEVVAGAAVAACEDAVGKTNIVTENNILGSHVDGRKKNTSICGYRDIYNLYSHIV